MATLLPDPDKTDRILITLAAEAYKHARQHLLAARAVLDVSVWPVAFSNAALALEEAGKGILCNSILVWPDEQRQAVQDAFRAAMNSHEAKAFCAFFVLRVVGDEVPESVEKLLKQSLRDARRTNKNKMRGFYTDSNSTGQILKPSDITEEQARQMVRVVEAVIAFSTEAEEAMEDPDAYLDMLRRVRGKESYASTWEYMGDDPSSEESEKVIAAMRALARDDAPLEEAARGTVLETFIDQMMADFEGPVALESKATVIAGELAVPPPAAAPDEQVTTPRPEEVNVIEIT
ncbi:AbiV family abortive infection protein [Streptomyces sp. NPDC006307]|uniref:AbiV family abortive infection protein n=1 Tax=Streptomyces sp. NPDC006307 TaxID=3156748 RepID=UPI0033B1DB42